ncbi:MAG TPA: hypothetical protein VFY45_09845, partial [Baekduia sp.]|nr:hypothetical protein [Baekduia sp.]
MSRVGGRAHDDVGLVGVLGGEAQRPALATAADDQARMRPAQRPRRAQRLRETVLAALERPVVVAPHLQADANRFLQALQPLAYRWERHPEPAVLALVPRGADRQLAAAAGQHVQRGDDLGQQPRVAVGDAGGEHVQLDALRPGGQEPQRRV